MRPETVRASSRATLQDSLDEAPLDRRFWVQFSLLSLLNAVDFFDYFIAGFLVSVVAPAWRLTFGQSALVLLGAGVGSAVGSLVGGDLADRFGRKPVMVICSIICGLTAGAVAFIPDGAWFAFAAFRFLTGVFISCVYAATVAMVVEVTPTRHRTVVGSLSFVSPSAGILLATVASASLLELLGWRGVALLAAAPALVGLACIPLLSESIPWLLSKGHADKARQLAAWKLGRPIEMQTPLPAPTKAGARDAAGYLELAGFPRQVALIFLIWFGVGTAVYGAYAWGPTIISLTHGVSPQAAARLFIWVSLGGISGKLVFSILPHWIGRRGAGLVAAGGGAVLLLVAALTRNALFAGLPVFLIALAIGDIFMEGGAAGMSPYSAEVFPVRLAARGAGVGQFGSAIGKILGPLALALIAGSRNVVAPKATSEAILPAFMFLSACLLVTFAAYLFFGIETRGAALEIADGPTTPTGDTTPRRSSPSLDRPA